MEELTNEALIDLLRLGDRDACGVFVARWYPMVWARLFRLSRNHEIASDLSQDVFVDFCQQTPFRGPQGGTQGQLNAWLRTVAHRKWCAYSCDPRRRETQRGEDRSDDTPDPGPGPQEQADAKELAIRLAVYMQRLPPNEQMVLDQRFYQERSYGEIATSLGEPEGTLRWRIHRAVQRLRRSTAHDRELRAWVPDSRSSCDL